MLSRREAHDRCLFDRAIGQLHVDRRETVSRMVGEIAGAMGEDIDVWHAAGASGPMVTVASDAASARLIAEDPEAAEHAFGIMVSLARRIAPDA